MSNRHRMIGRRFVRDILNIADNKSFPQGYYKDAVLFDNLISVVLFVTGLIIKELFVFFLSQFRLPIYHIVY